MIATMNQGFNQICRLLPTLTALVLLLGAQSSLAGNNRCGPDGTDPTHPSCKSNDEPPDEPGGGASLEAKFCLDMSTSNTAITPDTKYQGIGSDGTTYHDYCPSKPDKVSIFTGSGPGFRFDTNSGKNSVPPIVNIDFGPDGADTYDTSATPKAFISTFHTGKYEVDFRFHQASGGLEMGDQAIGDSGTVPIRMSFVTPDGGQAGYLAYGVGVPEGFSQLEGNPCLPGTAKAVVTRKSQEIWTIQSDSVNSDACLWDTSVGYDKQEGVLVPDMAFFFEITID